MTKLQIYRGNEKYYTFEIFDEDGEAVALSNYTIYFHVKSSDDATANYLISKSSVDSAQIEKLSTAGQCKIKIKQSDTSSWDTGTYYYAVNIVLTADTTKKYTVAKGEFVVEGEIYVG